MGVPLTLTPREPSTMGRQTLPPDTRVFIDFVFLRESIAFPRVPWSRIACSLPSMLTKSQRWLLEGGGRNESWNPVLPYSRNIRSVFKEERKGEEKRRIRRRTNWRRLSSDVGQKWRKEGSEERRLCADWSASSSPSRAAFQSKLILTIPVAFFDLRQCGGAREEAACAVA